MPKRKRWLAVAAAIAFLAVVEALSDSAFDGALPFPYDTITVVTVVGVVAIVAARLAFGTIDRLTDAVMERNRELESRNAALRAMYDVSLAVSAQTDLDTTFGSITDYARRLLGCEAAILALDEGGGLCLRSASSSVESEFPGPCCDRDPGSGAAAADMSAFLPQGLTIALDAPILRDGNRFGRLAVATAEPRAFGLHETEALDALATQAGIALEAARLKAEIAALAVQGERERIARDMHDGLAQVLGYVNTKSLAVEGLLADGRTDEARAQAAELSAAARSVYVDIREAILNLSGSTPENVDLGAALRDYAERYSESSKLAVRCEISRDIATASLSSTAKSEVFRIVREALTNVRKHAAANRVFISASIQPATDESAQLVIRVVDDGRGFDSELVGGGPENWPHFGLAGMRERAAAVGGLVEWHSKPGSGTEVEVCVPVAGAGSPPTQAAGGVPTGGLAIRGSDRLARRDPQVGLGARD